MENTPETESVRAEAELHELKKKDHDLYEKMHRKQFTLRELINLVTTLESSLPEVAQKNEAFVTTAVVACESDIRSEIEKTSSLIENPVNNHLDHLLTIQSMNSEERRNLLIKYGEIKVSGDQIINIASSHGSYDTGDSPLDIIRKRIEIYELLIGEN